MAVSSLILERQSLVLRTIDDAFIICKNGFLIESAVHFAKLCMVADDNLIYLIGNDPPNRNEILAG